jgi:hypothetical protein
MSNLHKDTNSAEESENGDHLDHDDALVKNITRAKNDNLETMTNSGTATMQVEWSPENEMIMVEWCDVAQCYKWLNSRSHQKFSAMNAWFTIPAIVLSTISGTASFAQTSLPLAYQVYSPMAIGAINIFIGILTTVHQYLKIAELNEAHRVSSISWDKFARNIRIELAKKPDERMDAGHFLKLNRQEFDRLMETSPTVKDDIIDEFNSKFRGKEGTIQRKRFEELKKPDICDTIISANETRHKWYLDLDKHDDSPIYDINNAEQALKQKDEMIREQQHKIKEKEAVIKNRQELELKNIMRHTSEVEESKKLIEQQETEYKQKSKCLRDYVTKFEDMYDRKPFIDEISDNMKDDVASDVLLRFLNEYASSDNV